LKRNGRWMLVGGKKYRLAERVGRLSKLGRVKLVFSRRSREKSWICMATNATRWGVTRVLSHYLNRWPIEVFHAQCGKKDNLCRGDRWSYSRSTGVAEVGTLVPATQAFRFRRKPMRDVKEDVVPPRAEQGAISVSL
jgi:hypothetical protein